MKWEDLLPGDKLKFSKETLEQRNREVWFEEFGNITLTIKKVFVDYKYMIIIVECFPYGTFQITCDNGSSIKYFPLNYCFLCPQIY